jgi:hypothetical protein
MNAGSIPGSMPLAPHYPVNIVVRETLVDRNRATVFFRPLLAIPHLLLVGGPLGFVLTGAWRDSRNGMDAGLGTGALGAVAAVCALIAWFFILFTGEYPAGLRSLVEFYLRWRVRATAYVTLLSDAYPPFGDENYPASLAIVAPREARNRWTVAFRPFLAIPHLVVLAIMGIIWSVTTIVAWIVTVATGRMPAALYHFGIGMMRWSTRVEAYLLLLVDEYPPFSLD